MQFTRLAELTTLTSKVLEDTADTGHGSNEAFDDVMDMFEHAQGIVERLAADINEVEYEAFDDLHDCLSDIKAKVSSKSMSRLVSDSKNGAQEQRAVIASLDNVIESIDALESSTKILMKGFVSHLPKELSGIIRQFEILEQTVSMSLSQAEKGFNDDDEVRANYEPDEESRAEDEEYERNHR